MSGSGFAQRLITQMYFEGDPLIRRQFAKPGNWALFTHNIVKVTDQVSLTLGARFPARVTYHDACSGLRELGVRDQPRRLLRSTPVAV